MKITRANVEQYAKEKGLEPIQIDGVPEGFAWKQPDVTISTTHEPEGKLHKGKTLIFKALADWADPKAITYE